MKVNIAIDGPSGAGKSTISKQIAQILGYTFINSGSIYRAVAYQANKHGYLLEQNNDPVQMENILADCKIQLLPNDVTMLNGEDISRQIRSEFISKITPIIAKIPRVREFVVDFIQKITLKDKGYIIDGRDTTYKIMPHAEVKVFLFADPQIRAKRRYEQLRAMNYDITLDEVIVETKLRDEQDFHRQLDPLQRTPDSVYIDSTSMEMEEVIDKILEIVKQKGGLSA
ncbi:(d)CMP kinase [Mycoplasma nasistruthionis]|uniref:Cytidylate kinase n=1 Tax=Mycoplasma nasistruthionis TaxID=353852 RepID=A0A5B7XW30_9MOLU|nr:(d)CMP kinase [Mycoplasma nasistruthionis]QCZ36937.1 (d)CMP kinase [Mycoplasma nasistruthionis]